MPAIDRTYKPRIWYCEECRAILGYVLRDCNRMRRLWVLREQLKGRWTFPFDDQFIFDNAESDGHFSPGIWRVRELDSGTIGCDFCGSLQTWYPTLDTLREYLRKLRGDIGVKEFDRLMKSVKI
ncbi:MAG: hypothetical protein ABSF99_08485 [Anaerolineales bacterium]|jgi:hypothetical protein